MGKNMAKDEQPRANIIILLTDGQPTVGITTADEILSNTRSNNTNQLVIYTVGFGEDVDFNFLKKLSLQSGGFARKVYTTSDAVLQLKNFYQEVSIPLLADVKITYETTGTKIREMTNNKFKIYTRGKEIMVAGKLTEITQTDSVPIQIKPSIEACSSKGNIELHPSTYSIQEKETQINLASTLERMWAYLTIKDLLDKLSKGTGGEEVSNTSISTLNAKAMEMCLNVCTQGHLPISLHYNFIYAFTLMFYQ